MKFLTINCLFPRVTSGAVVVFLCLSCSPQNNVATPPDTPSVATAPLPAPPPQPTPTPQPTPSFPTIKITKIPPSGQFPQKGVISGTVSGLSDPQNYRVVVYSETDKWYVQPYEKAPFTQIETDGTWGCSIFLGRRYGALLVRKTFRPENQPIALPEPGNNVLAVTMVPGKE